MPVIEHPTKEEIQAMVRVVPDHPRQGVMYQDMASIFNHPQGLLKVVTLFKNYINANGIEFDRIVGLDARGFPMAGALSAITGKPFAMARKRGKLPGETVSTTYELEYGKDELHLQIDAMNPRDRILIIDDVIATGGTLEAVTKLIMQFDANVVGVLAIMDLEFLGGAQKLRDRGYNVYSILKEE